MRLQGASSAKAVYIEDGIQFEGMDKRRPYLNIYYQGKRWMRLLKREKRTTIRKEIRGLSIVKKADIKEYDRLLESVGL